MIVIMGKIYFLSFTPSDTSVFKLCNGSALSKTANPALFNLIGYTYGGSGNGFLLPNIPDNKLPFTNQSLGQGRIRAYIAIRGFCPHPSEANKLVTATKIQTDIANANPSYN